MTNNISAQAFREAADTLAALIDKLPTLDVTWTPEIQADWFKAFDVLMEKVRGHLLAAAEQREQLDALTSRVENLKFDMNLVAAQLGITNREEVEPVVRKLLADQDMARQQIATLTAELTDARHERELMRVKLARATYQADTQ